MKRKSYNVDTQSKISRVDDDIRAKLWVNASERPSGNLSATREVRRGVRALSAECMAVIVAHFKQLYEGSREAFVASFRLLPDAYRERLARLLLSEYAEIISLTVIQELFAMPPSVRLDHAIPALNRKQYPKLLRELPGALTTLELIGFTELSDASIPLLVKKSPGLRTLRLRGCLSIGEKAIEAISTLTELEHLDVSFTAVTLAGLARVLTRCCALKRLDINGVGKVSSKNTAQWDQMLDSVVNSSVHANLQPLSKLEHLNVAECNISDAALGRWLALTPSLNTLDCHECEITNPLLFIPPNLYKQLTKIDISGMSLDLRNFADFYQQLLISANIQGLWMSGVTRNISASDNEYLLTDERMTPADPAATAASGFAPSEINWSNNPRLRGSACLAYHITSSLKYLNLSGSTFDGRAFNDAIIANKPTRLENLQLNDCTIDSDVVEGITRLTGLRALGVSKTTIDEEALDRIIDSCPLLDSLNLTLSRSIPVRYRRTYFDYYNERR
ncbi:hypothetical protein E3P99_04083 [Wallemia hederae]|uniref:F-box/LRR-repeat protein 15/At3g58940/PEG3-like LRR domain-containing protein n=1 Tax=Wallemia hederae TaxID=1540922 RepID=A0A4T0FBA5_9BASI|nr:hypothetical protein E3P99_04083 [Wallemia hederae]